MELKTLVLGEEGLNLCRPWEGEIGTKLIWLLFIYLLLEENCFTMSCWFPLQIRHNSTYIICLSSLPPQPSSPRSRSSQSSRLGSLCCMTTSLRCSVLHMVYILQCYFLHSSPSFLPPLCPQDSSLSLLYRVK